jgi:hypothetical protein
MIDTEIKMPTQFQNGIDCHRSGRKSKYSLPIPQAVQQIQNGTANETLQTKDKNQPITGNAFMFIFSL